MKVLVDTNIVMDVLLKREPFYEDSFTIFQLANVGGINGVLAAVSMTNIFYLLRKTQKALDAVQFAAPRESGVTCIITRNVTDYEGSDISCIDPTDFIAYFKEKEAATEV